MKTLPKYKVNEISVNRVNLDSAYHHILDLCNSQNNDFKKLQKYICATDSHVIYQAHKNDQLKNILENSFLTTPDGMPLVWTAWLQGMLDVGRVYGPDLMLKLCDEGRKYGLKHYFYGSHHKVLTKLTTNLENKFKGLKIVGKESPPFRELDSDELILFYENINKLNVDILWLGLGAPKQEHFAALINDNISAKVICCVGAAFDFHAGCVSQAPVWMQRNGLEWIFRLINEPRRLWKRYLLGNTAFLVRTIKSLIKNSFK